jgi:hypothetical protein
MESDDVLPRLSFSHERHHRDHGRIRLARNHLCDDPALADLQEKEEILAVE